jgi:hypothetical protein
MKPSSPAMTRCPSRFDEPDTLKSQKIPRAQTPTREAPAKPTVSTAVTLPPLSKESKRQRFLSDSSGASGDELPPPAVLVSPRAVPASEVRTTSVASTPAAAKSATSSATSTSGASTSDAGPPSRKTRDPPRHRDRLARFTSATRYRIPRRAAICTDLCMINWHEWSADSRK